MHCLGGEAPRSLSLASSYEICTYVHTQVYVHTRIHVCTSMFGHTHICMYVSSCYFLARGGPCANVSLVAYSL